MSDEIIEAASAMYFALRNTQCTCTRQYKLYGKSVKMCSRCKALIMWEKLIADESETEKVFNTEIPK